MKNRIISAMMALVLVLGSCPVAAFAGTGAKSAAETVDESGEITENSETTESGEITETPAIGNADEEEGVEENTSEVTISEDGTFTFSFDDRVWETGEEETAEYEDNSSTATGKVVNVNTWLNLRSGAGTEYEVIGKIFNGSEVEIIGEEDGWYQVMVPEQTGYVYGDYLEVLENVDDSDPDGMDEFFMLMLFSLLMQGDDADTDTSLALTPDGNLSLIDDIDTATAENTGKQFITVETKNGNYFYLIIDRDDEGEETVHFLNQVDEADLLALMDEEEVEEYEASQNAEAVDDTDGEEAKAATSDDNQEETENTGTAETEKESFNFLPVILLVVILAVGGGFYAYTKVKGKKAKEAKPDPDADYEDEEEEDYEVPDMYEEDADADDSDGEDSSFDDDEPV